MDSPGWCGCRESTGCEGVASVELERWVLLGIVRFVVDMSLCLSSHFGGGALELDFSIQVLERGDVVCWDQLPVTRGHRPETRLLLSASVLS